MVTKALALWLFIVGVAWAFGIAWFHLVMSAITDPVLPLPLHFFAGFVGPAVLIVGTILLMANWYSRLGSIFALVACVWLTWLIAPSCVEAFRSPSALDTPTSYIVGAVLCLIL